MRMCVEKSIGTFQFTFVVSASLPLGMKFEIIIKLSIFSSIRGNSVASGFEFRDVMESKI